MSFEAVTDNVSHFFAATDEIYRADSSDGQIISVGRTGEVVLMDVDGNMTTLHPTEGSKYHVDEEVAKAVIARYSQFDTEDIPKPLEITEDVQALVPMYRASADRLGQYQALNELYHGEKREGPDGAVISWISIGTLGFEYWDGNEESRFSFDDGLITQETAFVIARNRGFDVYSNLPANEGDPNDISDDQPTIATTEPTKTKKTIKSAWTTFAKGLTSGARIGE